MSETLFGQLIAVIIAAVILASLAGTVLAPAITYFFTIAGMVFGVGAIAVVVVIVLKR